VSVVPGGAARRAREHAQIVAWRAAGLCTQCGGARDNDRFRRCGSCRWKKRQAPSYRARGLPHPSYTCAAAGAKAGRLAFDLLYGP